MRQMVEEIHRGLFNIEQAAIKFEVNRKTVKHWLDKVEQEALAQKESSEFPLKRPSRKKKTPPVSLEQASAQLLELQTIVHSLERELDAANFKALYYSTLVKVAEQELGIAIEKKSVTKRSDSCS
ncbi:hypothetical protein HUW48_08845 [Adhaeribacter radiodurans]|uniref:Insertion element IS150 protein InsJ-like helix-turn-helix domain-containing protein n=2 Tax=Adhaeribacter radiodurans TaxID=2745197 RepID=A0A7L7LFB9_9BACT|nr:hypothetical protein HUW48_08845 [Adhaeribacter radiodurans]